MTYTKCKAKEPRRIIKLPKAPKQENGSAYITRLKVDYGIPTLRVNNSLNDTNSALRTGLTQPQLKKVRIAKAQRWA